MRRGPNSRLRVVVSGLIAQYPLGGVAWDYAQYAAGFARLGHDVTYVEDSGIWPYNPHEGGISTGCDFNVRQLESVMERFGLAGRWAYRFPFENQWFGMREEDVRDAVREADLVVNVSGMLARPQDYHPEDGVLVLIDSDPGFTQVKLARDQQYFQAVVDAHDAHFTFGETLVASGVVPNSGHVWRPTRQPVLMDEWRPNGQPRSAFTTVMNWTSYEAVRHGELELGQKDVEFRRFLDLPDAVAPAELELAVNVGKTRHTPRDLLARRGWTVVHPDDVCPDVDGYHAYVSGSRAEWSVAKSGYVVTRSGWFSCRSACYLAAGRPVVLQDTGYSDVLPSGEGLLAFSTFDEAVAGIQAVESDYARHASAALDLAAEYFASDRVLSRLLDDLGL